jgi:hypothetical protein
LFRTAAMPELFHCGRSQRFGVRPMDRISGLRRTSREVGCDLSDGIMAAWFIERLADLPFEQDEMSVPARESAEHQGPEQHCADRIATSQQE